MGMHATLIVILLYSGYSLQEPMTLTQLAV